LIYNLKQVDYRVRRYVAGCLASIVSNPICKECADDAAFVLALFSSIGFGTPKDDQETQKLLRLSARSLEELQKAIQRILNINSDPIVQQSPFNEKLDRWRANGLTIGSIRYHSANALETFVDALKQEAFELETALGPENAVVYTTKWALAELFQARGQFTQCEALLKSLIKRLVTDEIYGDSCHQTLIMKSALASLYQDMGRYAQAIELQATVVEKYEALFGVTHWWSLDAKGTLADMYATDGHHSIAESIIVPVCQEWERQFETDSLHYAWGLTMWANALHGVGKVHTAKEKMQTAVMMYTEKLGEFHLDTLHANRQLAGICLSMDESVAAEDLLQQTKYGHELTITEGECPPDYLSTLVKLSGVLADNGNWKEAKALTEKAMSYVQNLYPAESTEYWQCLDSQNYIYRHEKDWQQVNGISREGLKLSLKLYGTGHWKALLFRATLAESSLELGLLVDAETTLLEALQESQAVEGLDRAWRFKCLVDLGRVYESQDRQDAAVDRFLQALELSREIYGTDHQNTQSAEGWLEGGIDLLTDRHDLDFKVAEPFYRKARDTWMSAYGNEHSRTIEAQARYARLLFGSWTQNKEEGKLRDATVTQKDLVTILNKKFGRDHEDTINALFELWKLYDWLGHTEDAREVGEELQLTSYGRDLLLGVDNVGSGCPVHRRGVPGADERD
jgi:tetratricopeptide (TPR) repeat protein